MVHHPRSGRLVGGANLRDPPLPPVPQRCLLPMQQERYGLLDERNTTAIFGDDFHGGGKVLQESHHIMSVHLIVMRD